MVVFTIVCAVAGFVFFPAWGLMTLWNYVATNIYPMPHMNLLLGFMLYAVVILTYIATKPNKTFFGISSADLTDSNIAAIMKDLNNKK